MKWGSRSVRRLRFPSCSRETEPVATEFDMDFDLYAETAVGDVRDPYPDYAEARRERPVELFDWYGVETYRVYRYADCDAVLSDPETFSSKSNQRMEIVMGPGLLGMDGREHHSHRGLVASAFRRRAIEDWTTALIEPTVHELIDRFAARGR